MIGKALEMRRAKRLNRFFTSEFRTQKSVLDLFDRRLDAEGCPMFMVYHAGGTELDARLKSPDSTGPETLSSPSRAWSTSNARWKTASPRNRSSWSRA